MSKWRWGQFFFGGGCDELQDCCDNLAKEISVFWVEYRVSKFKQKAIFSDWGLGRNDDISAWYGSPNEFILDVGERNVNTFYKSYNLQYG